MKINIKPAAYLVTGSSMFKDRVALNESYANGIISERGPDGSRIEPLHPESLMIELAQMLKRITDVYAEVRREISEDHPDAGWTAESMTIDESREFLKKITDGSAS